MRILILLLTIVAARPADACTGCKQPTLTEYSKQAEAIVAGTVKSADKHEHSVIAVDVTWKGSAGKTIERTGCWRLFERVGSKVIVMTFPAGWKMHFVDECSGVYSDTPANRATLTKLFGAPS